MFSRALKGCVLSIMICLVLISIGCQSQNVQSGNVSNPPNPQQVNPSTNPARSVEPKKANSYTGSIRAIGKTNKGDFLVTADGKDQVEDLQAPSCFGLADDKRISGTYGVVFQDLTGKQTIVAELKNLEIITPDSSKIIQMKRDKLDGVDLLFFYPQYSHCHELFYFVFGLDQKTGEPFQISFKIDQQERLFYQTYIGERPKVVDQKLQAVVGGFTSNQFYTATFKFDREAKQFILENREPIVIEPREITREEKITTQTE